MWRDEAVTVAVAGRPLPETWALLQQIDAVHGLYYLLAHGWFALFGDGLWALRVPSVLATAVAAAGVAALGRRLWNARAGLLAGLAYPLLPPVLHHAQEGRSYAMVAAALVWATWTLVRAVERPGAAGRWGGYAALALLACWLNLFAGFALLAHGVALWRAGADHRVWRPWLTACGAVGLGVLPLALMCTGQAEGQLGWLSRPGAGEWAAFLAVTAAGWVLARYTAGGGPTDGARLTRGRLAGGGLAGGGLALALLAVPPGTLLLLSMAHPYYVDRYVLYAFAGLALLLGAAADRALDHRPARARRGAVLAVAAAVLAGLLLPWPLDLRGPQSRKDDALAVAAAVRELAAPGDAVLFTPARRRDWLLHDRATYRSLDDVALARSPEDSGTLRGVEHPAAELPRRVRAAHRVVVLADPPDQPLDDTADEVAKRDVLARHFRPCREIHVHGARVTLWSSVGCPRRR
ncbi:glycosyltransferase family 39 protein [Streptomyces durbertensis]|uniref:Glycosyltransferase family 39 protein n=2 Tax=Streptomyces durbertensis TaxID=2448886 RepID=A0ABR6EFV2_9ACTN|nr:glycosyltransferase family 39 protein [Streptomyces durbertensis]